MSGVNRSENLTISANCHQEQFLEFLTYYFLAKALLEEADGNTLKT